MKKKQLHILILFFAILMGGIMLTSFDRVYAEVGLTDEEVEQLVAKIDFSSINEEGKTLNLELPTSINGKKVEVRNNGGVPQLLIDGKDYSFILKHSANDGNDYSISTPGTANDFYYFVTITNAEEIEKYIGLGYPDAMPDVPGYQYKQLVKEHYDPVTEDVVGWSMEVSVKNEGPTDEEEDDIVEIWAEDDPSNVKTTHLTPTSNPIHNTGYGAAGDYVRVRIKQDGIYSFTSDVYEFSSTGTLSTLTGLSEGGPVLEGETGAFSRGKDWYIYVPKDQIDTISYRTWEKGSGGVTASARKLLKDSDLFEIEELTSGDGGIYTHEEEIYNESPSLMESVERMLADMFTGVATGINLLVSAVLGRMVTIDDFVFNYYDETKLVYFESPGAVENASKIIWGADGTGTYGIYGTVNKWYSFFRSIAIIGYLMMLIYMGIRIMLASTGQKLSQYKVLFMYWVIGVVLLFFYPYVMKYAIKLNDAFVRTVDSSKISIIGDDATSISSAEIESASALDYEHDKFSSSPFKAGGTDYMSVIADRANTYHRLATALAYLIMTWQLITLAIHYYKRLLMTGFLIAIFPMVVLFYAVDKIADGKSQSFNKWNKEFILNVFIQSFHAIVYVFVCGTVYAAGGLSNGDFDYVLIIVGVTFLFTGEEIIKKIFSQESKAGVTKSLATTAAATYGAVKLAEGAAKGVTKPFIGKNSLINRVRTAGAENKLAKKKEAMFDSMATNVEAPNTGARLSNYAAEMARVDAMPETTDAERAQKEAERQHVRDVANAVATLNNPDSASYEELAKAMEIVKRERQVNPDSALLNDLSMNETQLDAIVDIGTLAATMTVAGVLDPITIERELTMRLEIAFDGMDEHKKERYENAFFTNMAIYGTSMGYTAVGTENEFYDNLNDAQEFESNMDIVLSEHSSEHSMTDEQKDHRRTAFASAYAEMGDDLTPEEKRLAQSIATYRNLNSDAFTTKEKLAAMREIREKMENVDGSNTVRMQQMLQGLDNNDFEIANHIFARRVLSDTMHTSSDNRRVAREIVDEYESEAARAEYDEDEISIHEVISVMNDEDARAAMLQEKYAARGRANQRAREETIRVGTDILARRNLDIQEGGIDTRTRYLMGQTREDILEERRRASRNRVRRLVGFKTENEAGYSESYVQNMRNYNRHFYGDNPNMGDDE